MKTHPFVSTRIEILEARIAPAAVASVALGALDGSDGFKLSGIASTTPGAR